MTRRLAFFPLILLSAFFSGCLWGDVQSLSSLPPLTYPNSVQTDASSNIYLAGYYAVSSAANALEHVFVAKLSPDGSQLIWFTKLAGSSYESASAIAVGGDGSVYVTGTTASTDFPTTPGSMQPTPTFTLTTAVGEAFLAKLNPGGAVIYSTFIPGASSAPGIAVDSAGDAFVTGYQASAQSGFAATPGAITANTSAYIIEVNPRGSAPMIAIAGFGGVRIALDASGFIYSVGTYSSAGAPATPGAFQSTVTPINCGSGLFIAFPCVYQYISKIDPTGTKLIYGTYLDGQYGVVAYGLAVDGSGEVIIAGSTNGADYPVTPGAYQSIYSANPVSSFLPPALVSPPVNAGYVTKLNSTGTALVWSSYFGGSGSNGALPQGGFTAPEGDQIRSMAVDSSGNIVIGGVAFSPDLPGLATTPVASRPSQTTPMGFVARFSPDGSRISATQLLASADVNQISIAVRADGTVAVGAAQPEIVTIPPDGRVFAIADPADNARVVNVAPGQLLTLYGTNLAPIMAVPILALNGTFPTTFEGVTVTFNGIAAPILYVSGIQINLQVPYEIAGQTQVTMQISSQMVSPPVSESYILGVAPISPSVFLSASNFTNPVFSELTCNGTTYFGVQALAINPDGTLNSCTNPAAAGLPVTIFVNGAGVTSPALPTGSLNPPPGPAINEITPLVSILVADSAMSPGVAQATEPAAGSISSVVESVLALTQAPAAVVPLEVGGVMTREQSVVIWVKP